MITPTWPSLRNDGLLFAAKACKVTATFAQTNQNKVQMCFADLRSCLKCMRIQPSPCQQQPAKHFQTRESCASWLLSAITCRRLNRNPAFSDKGLPGTPGQHSKDSSLAQGVCLSMLDPSDRKDPTKLLLELLLAQAALLQLALPKGHNLLHAPVQPLLAGDPSLKPSDRASENQGSPEWAGSLWFPFKPTPKRVPSPPFA